MRGNQTSVVSDLLVMDCRNWREQLSADMDGQADPMLLDQARDHAAHCAQCTAWLQVAAQVNRLARVMPAVTAPGVSQTQLDAMLAHLPRSRPWRRYLHYGARAALALVGVAQLLVGALPMAMSGADDLRPAMMGAGMIHMSHEYAAWTIALGIAFVAGAGWTRHLAGILPALTCFVLILSIVSAIDLLGGNVNAAHVTSHVLLVLALVLIVVIVSVRPPQRRPQPGATHRNNPDLSHRPKESANPTDHGFASQECADHDPAAHHRAA